MHMLSAEYVRNHGAVPKLEWDTHKITVKGMVDKPMTFTMDDLVNKFENVNLLCTLVCAGNRRKEQNMVKKTKGFNWGASGTGTGQLTSCLHCDFSWSYALFIDRCLLLHTVAHVAWAMFLILVCESCERQQHALCLEAKKRD